MSKEMIPENDNRSLIDKLITISEELARHCEKCGLYMNSNLELCEECSCINVKVKLENIIKCEANLIFKRC